MAWNEPGGKGNNNDPWGNNNGGGNRPPDLDEAFKQFMDKLNGLLGGKGSGSNNGGSDNGGIGGLLSIVGVVALGLLAFNAVYQLDEQERGVVLRTGTYIETQEPGLHWKIPVIDEVIPVNTTKVREAEIRERMLTEDENIVEVELNVQYRVADPVAFALRVEDPELTLSSASESALRHEVGSTAMDPILTTGRAVLADVVKLRLQDYLDRYRTGISLTNVNIKDARPPQQVKEAFDDVQKAKQDKERFINEAEAYANSVVPEARGRAQRQLEEASAYQQRIVSRAEGEAARFQNLLGEYRKAPAVTRERLYIEAVTSVYSNSNKILVDVEGGNNMMYLPLDKVMQSMPATNQSSSTALSSSQTSRIADQVINELRSRQNNNTPRREGR